MRTILHVCMLMATPVLMLSGCGPSDTATDASEQGSTSGDDAQMGDREDASNDESQGVTATAGSGVRPGSAPADLPNIPGAHAFAWLSFGSTGMLSYEVNGTDYRAVCAAQLGLLVKAGWKESEGYEMDVDGAMVKTLEKADATVMVTCGDNTEEGSAVHTISVALNRTKK